MIRNARVALRHLRAQPLFSLTVVGMLAVGIAGNAAIFSIFNALFLRPLPFTRADRLVELDETAPRWNLRYVGVANPDFYHWRRSNSTFDSMAFFAGASFNLSDGRSVERVEGAQVTHDMLNVLRLQPLMGRNFSAEEDRPGGAKVVLLNYDLWQTMFRGDRGVLGQMVKLDEQPYTVVGVLPRGAVFPDRAALWIPLAADPDKPSGYFLNGLGRLKPGVSLALAQADLTRIHRAMVPAGRRVNEITSPVVTPVRDRYLGDFKVVSRVLLAAVGMVLLIACVNIAAMILVRSSARAREMAIRNALGASRRRIAALPLTESALLAAGGALAGIPLGAVCLRAVVSRLPAEMPQWIAFTLDWRFALFCALMVGLAALLFGLAPVLQASRIDIRDALQSAATRTTASRGRRAALAAFAAGQIALALMLSTSAGLLVEAFRKVQTVAPGFRPQNVLTFAVTLPDTGYGTPEQKIAYYRSLLDRLGQLPGVQAAGATSSPPLGGHWGGQFEAEGARIVSHDDNPVVLRVAATPGYFDAIGAALLGGRVFDVRDAAQDAPPVAMVNQTFARHFWPGTNPVGRRIRYPGGSVWYQVVGLLRDERHDGLDQAPVASVFLPYSTALRQAGADDLRSLRTIAFVLRGAADPALLAGPAREMVRQADPGVPLYALESMGERLDQSMWARRAYSWLFGVFAAIAIFMAAAGVYGTVSYSVSQRTREMGIRVALGAQPAQVLRQVLGGGMALVAAGVAAGLAGAWWSTSLLSRLLFGVSPRDPLLYAGVAAGIALAGLLANWLPARRAAEADPMRALHFE